MSEASPTEPNIWVCKNCDYNVNNEYERCWNCGYSKDGNPPEDAKAFQEAKITASLESQEKTSWSSVLRVCGYVDFAAGLIFALILLVGALNTKSELSSYYAGLGVGLAISRLFLLCLIQCDC
ncbi:MAG TPA: hypothetical protein VGN95_10130 [Pyrinomonadaceae bacterium]|jgi:hypothetical protein|nr:hypothetical protein [Pyrinomonadaceae bacterium]